MTDYPDRPGYSFNPGPPPEASRFFRNKGLRPSFGYEDVEPEEHAVAYAVAKMGELDLLEAAKAETLKVLDEGLPFEAFQKSWRNNPALTDWWGKKEMTDPLTGEVKLVQLGSPRRLRTIYIANLATARAAGQWARIERNKDAFPYLEYTLGPSERHRPHHEDKAGLILPVESAFWDEWMPPNGWGCKCKVRVVTRREAARRGVSTTPDVPDQVFVNKRTGTRSIVPQGIDPGWQRNPGKLRREAAEGMLKERLEAAPEAVRRAAFKDIATSWFVQRLMTDPKAVGAAAIGIIAPDIMAASGASARIVEISDVTRDHLAPDRRLSDLIYVADMDKSARVILQTPKGWKHPRLVFRIDSAINPASDDPYDRLPLWLFVVIKPNLSVISTFFRAQASKETEIVKKAGRVLKGE
jgi:hypothetical protein